MSGAWEKVPAHRATAAPSRSGGYFVVKRIVDLLLAGTGLVILSPLLVLIVIAIRLDSPGPAIFRQTRMGKGNRLFTMYKFRTMRQGVVEVAKDILIQSGGMATVTRVGRVLRRTSFDELPQLLNVIAGQMSLIGPRPALPTQQDLIAARRETGVDKVLPGITGYAQVMGREDLSLGEKVACDAHYVEHLSFWLDLRIFILSIHALAKGRGAY